MVDKKFFFDVIDRFSTIKALVIGDVMLDIYEYCLTSESKPLFSEKPNKRAYKSQKAIKTLGGAGNVAANLSSLDVKTSLAGITGNDENYFKLRELCDSNDIKHLMIRDSSRPTTTKTRLYIDDEYLLRRDDECIEKLDNETTAAITKEILRVIPDTKVVILSDYNKGLFTHQFSHEIIRECRMHSIPIIVDFKPINALLFSGADVVCPNEHEAVELSPSFTITSLESSTKELFKMFTCKSIVITLGKNGLAGFDGKSFFHVKGHKVKSCDAVGCGDTVRAGLALGLTLGLNLNESVELANFAAAVIVQKPNTSTVTRLELKKFIDKKLK